MKAKSRILSLLSVFLMTVLSLSMTACKGCNRGRGEEPPVKTEWPEAGVYYYSVGTTECELTLQEGGTFLLAYNGNNESGSFLLNGNVLTLDFLAEGKDTVEATYESGVVTLTYNGAVMRMLKKINYTVTFETGGGTPIASATVLNGKTVTKPADPTREGYLFVGWYKDSGFTTPFTFASDVVTSDITVYARWVEKPEGAREYTVAFELGYDGDVAPAARVTMGGRLFDVPHVERDGFVFGGWWISSDKDPARLSYKHTEETVFTEDTTLYAVWLAEGSTKLEAPSLTVDDNGIRWDAIVGARSYGVTVTDADGVVVFSRSTGAVSVNISFAEYAAGIYRIKVVAHANTGAEDASESFYTLVNKGLGKVSGFFVSGDSTLVFDGVAGAEKYLVTVICGNAAHKHTDFDNGSSKTFSFANCPMTDEGIRFVVKAVADGYLTSVSDEFIYKRELAPLGGLVWSEEESIVRWDAVDKAEYYMVSVACGNALHTHGFVNNGTAPFVDLKECAPVEGGISVKVYPVADGYILPAVSEITVNKQNLKTPGGIAVNDMLLRWDADAAAARYEIAVNGTTYETVQNQFDLSSAVGTEAGARYTVTLRAIGETSSAWSDPMVVVYYAMDPELAYSRNTVSWKHVVGADFYEVQVNDGAIVRIDGGVNAARIALSRDGVNTVKVRFADGELRSAWAILSVTAYSVTFDTLGGDAVSTQYKAPGDEIELPTAAKPGYRFVSWYNVPGGPDSNGKEITGAVYGKAEAVVLYAYYTPEAYEITYNYGVGGTGAGLKGEVEYERDYILEVPTPTDITCAFGGWFSAPYGNGIQYTDGSGKSLAPWNILGGLELYAFWNFLHP